MSFPSVMRIKRFYNIGPQVDLSSLIEGGVDDDDVIVDTDADADADADAERPKKSSAMVFPELDASASSRRPSRYEFYQTLVREDSSTTNSSTGQLVDCQLVERVINSVNSTTVSTRRQASIGDNWSTVSTGRQG